MQLPSQVPDSKEATPPEAAPTKSLPRLRMLLLLGCASLLVLDGPTRRGTSAPPPGTEGRAAQVACAVSKRSASLSPAEQARLVAAVIRYGEKYDVAPDLLLALLDVESSWRPWVRSPKGALGLMQIMPHMAAQLGLAGNPTTLETNVEAGALILSDNIRRLGEDDGISAYFWGSDIRGVAYRNRVAAARTRLRALLEACQRTR